MPYIGKSPQFGVRNRFVYVASSGDTSVSGADANGATLTFTDGAFVDVYLNGVLLKPTTDYNTTTANTIAGLSALNTSDEVTVVVYDVFTVADAVSATSGGTFSGGVNIDGAVTINESSADVDFRVESNGNANMLFVDGGNDKVGIGTGSPNDYYAKDLVVNSADEGGITILNSSTHAGGLFFADGTSANAYRSYIQYDHNTDEMVIATAATHAMKIDANGTVQVISQDLKVGNNASADAQIQFDANASDWIIGIDQSDSGFFKFCNSTALGTTTRITLAGGGEVGFGNTSSPADDDTVGVVLNADGNTGLLSVSRNGADCAKFNRKSDDGTLIELMGQGSAEGTISVSGGTVSYNGFTGSHWSRLTDNSKPTMLRGTVIETIDEMCDWYQVEFTKPSPNKAKYEEGDTIPEGSAVGDIILITVKRSIELPDGKSVGDNIEYTDLGEKYTGKIIKEHDIKHVKSKISDTADCTNVYGVFSSWDNDDDTVNDMYVNSIGTAVVRIHKDQTVAKGDLITSNGDGTAKKQDDDIIRSKTIGKVLTNIKQETYSDGSYTVPCALYCG